MLANGTKLGFKTTSEATTYTNLTGLKEVPELGNEPEKVENTPLSAKTKQYEFGIGDPGDLEYKFSYDNKSATSPYRVMRKAEEDKSVLYFQEELPDGTKYSYPAQVSIKLSSGAVNGVMEFTLKMALQDDIEVTDPE